MQEVTMRLIVGTFAAVISATYLAWAEWCE